MKLMEDEQSFESELDFVEADSHCQDEFANRGQPIKYVEAISPKSTTRVGSA